MALVQGLLERIDNTFYTIAASLVPRPPDNAAAAEEHKLPPFGGTKNDGQLRDDGSIVLNSVVLPKLVADQIRRLGYDLLSYNEGQLEAATLGCAVDCNLIDDPDGVNFFDDLQLDERERAKDDRDKDDDEVIDDLEQEREDDDNEVEELDLYCRNMLRPGRGNVFIEPSEATGSVFFDRQFREKIKNERDQQRERKKRSLYANDDGEEGEREKPERKKRNPLSKEDGGEKMSSHT